MESNGSATLSSLEFAGHEITQVGETNGYLATVEASRAASITEIQGAIVLARQFPRDETGAFTKMMRSAKRESFAKKSAYSFPRGGSNVSGPSVYLARDMARCWGNMRYGATVIADDEDSQTIEGWAWDIETNTKTTAQATFKKLVQRKRDGQTQWVKPDERDLRELVNKQASLCIRNCILSLMPPDYVEDLLKAARKTLSDGAKIDIADSRKNVAVSFSGIGVTARMIADYLGHSLDDATPDEIAELIQIGTSIKEGQSKWAEYVQAKNAVNVEAESPMQTAKRSRPAKKGEAPPTAEATEKPAEPAVAPNDYGLNEKQMKVFNIHIGAHDGISETQLAKMIQDATEGGQVNADVLDELIEKAGAK